MAHIAHIANLLKTKATTDKEKYLMKELFAAADRNKDGHIDYKEYARMFTAKGLRLSEEEVKKVFEAADKNNDRKLSRDEVMEIDEEEDLQEKAQVAFKAYDRNKDGVISKREMLLMSGSKLSKEQIERCFEKHDADGDGFLDAKELENMMRKGKEAKKKKATGSTTSIKSRNGREK